MAKRLFLSTFVALAACGVFFYLFYMLALVWMALTGPLNAANHPELQSTLRHVAAPISLALGVIAFAITYRQMRRREARREGKVIVMR